MTTITSTTKDDLVTIVAEHAGCSRAAAGDAVQGILDAIGEAIAKGGEVRLRGFGSFARHQRPAGTGRNPRTGAEIAIAARFHAKFSPAKALKALLATA